MDRSLRSALGWLAACGFALAACAGDGAGQAAPDAAVGPPAGLSFQELYPRILERRCVSCHKPGGLCAYLDMSTPALAYQNLVNARPAAEGLCASAGRRVIARDCASSLLYRKLLPVQQPCGSRMPLRDVPLTDEETEAICQWIEAGAPP